VLCLPGKLARRDLRNGPARIPMEFNEDRSLEYSLPNYKIFKRNTRFDVDNSLPPISTWPSEDEYGAVEDFSFIRGLIRLVYFNYFVYFPLYAEFPAM
jgi:hypothetical protein